jgi:hypothetical protein
MIAGSASLAATWRIPLFCREQFHDGSVLDQDLLSRAIDCSFLRDPSAVGSGATGMGPRAPAIRWLEVSGLILTKEDTSDQFQFVSGNLDGDRTLNGFDGNHEIVLSILFKDSLQIVQAPTSNSYLLPNLEEGVQSAGNLLQ